MAQGVINDLVAIKESGIRVRSHKTFHEDMIEARRLKIWWERLVAHGSASLHAGDPNNPHPWRSSIVGALLLAGLPDRLQRVKSDTIEFVSE